MGCHEGLKSSLRSLAVRPSEIYLLVFFIHVSQSISRRSSVDHSRNAIAIPPASTLTKLCQSFFSCTSLSVSSKALHCALTRKIYPCQCHVLPSKEDLSSSRSNIQFSIFASSSRQRPESKRKIFHFTQWQRSGRLATKYGILRFSALAGCHFHQIADIVPAEPA